MKSHYEILKAMKTGFSTDFRTAICARSISSKEYERFISGQPPLILSDSVGKPLVEWSITGNTVQDGEPSPESPIEVKGVGDKTENLFTDKTVYHNTIGEDSFWYSSSTSSSIMVEVQPNTKYYIKTNTVLPIFRVGLSRNRPDVLSKFVNTYRLTNTNTLEVTTGDNINYLVFQGSQSLESTWLDELYVGQGYKIVEVTRGKNLFDKTEWRRDSNSGIKKDGEDAYIIETVAYQENYNLYILPDSSKRYTLSFDCEWLSDRYKDTVAFRFTKRKDGGLDQVNATEYFTGIKRIVIDFESADYTGFSFGGWAYSGKLRISNIMLELGSTATEYEPYHAETSIIYLNSPLMADEVLDSTGKREVEWKKLVLTGDETINSAHADIGLYNFTGITNYTTKSGVISYCTHYNYQNFVEGWSKVNDNSIAFYFNPNNDNRLLYVRDSRYTTLDSFKAFLKSEYEKGTPVTIYYQLAEPTSETVDIPTIPTLKGNTVLDVDTEVQPTNMAVKYFAKKGGAE